MENYSSLLRIITKSPESELSDICVNITTTESFYPLSFIEFEDEQNLGIYYTAEDFSERFVILNKKYIVSVGLAYKQDLVIESTDIPFYE